MAFYEAPSFPTELAYGAQGGPEFSTDIFETIGGHEGRNQNRQHPRARFEIGLVNKTLTETQSLLAFFNAVAKGRANAFRFKNLANNDYQGATEPIGTGDASDTTFQLIKRYTSGVYTYDKPIYKPISGTVRCFLNGTETTAFTVDTTTGVVTFSAAPGSGVAITATFEYELPVRFNTDWFSCSRVDPDIYSWPSIELLETLDIA